MSFTLRSSGGDTALWGPMVGGGRWYSLDWSCCADGQGRVSRTHSTGSSQAAFCPWTCGREQVVATSSVQARASNVAP